MRKLLPNTKFKIPNSKQLQRGFIKLTKHTLVSYLIVSTVLVGTGLIYLFNPFNKSAEAAWFNDNWGYRQEVPVTANTGVDTNTYISFSLDTATLITAGKLQSSCQDIRVTDMGGNLLAYHVGRTNACNNAATTIDALVPTLGTGASTFYVYYGNPSALSADAGAFSQSEATSYTVGSLGTEAKAPGPILYWKLDDATGTNAQDSSSNNLDGTLAASTATPTWQTEDQCISGKCLYFDGSNDEVTAADTAALDLTGDFTISAWVNRASGGAGAQIVSKTNGSDGGYAMLIGSSGEIYCRTSNGSTFNDSLTATGVLNADNTWHQATIVRSGTSCKVYFDGNDRTNSAGTHTTLAANSNVLAVGTRPNAGGEFWKGKIDDVKIYNFALTAAQIKANFDTRGTAKETSEVLGTAVNNQPGALSNGLVGYWKTDESSGTAADSSGNGTTLTNNNTVAYAAGKFGNAASFTAASSMYLSTASTISGVKTVSFWTNNASTTDEYLNLITSTAYITSSSGTVSATGFTSPTIYVNGVVNGTLTASVWNHVVITSDTAINATAFEIGRGNGSYNNGKIDETRLYNRALSAADVAQLYNFAPGPVGKWDLEEGSGTSAFDTSGNANTGTITAGTGGYTTGKFGKAYSFDGTDTVINAGSGTTLDNLPATAGMSLDAWVYPKSAGENNAGFIMAKNVGTSPSAGWIMQLSSTKQITFTVDGSTDLVRTTTDTLTSNAWSHVSMTWDGVITTATSVHIYINGVEAAYTTSTNGAARVDDASSTFFIGNDSTSARTFDGYIDQVRAFNYALTQGQAVADMNAGHPAPGSPVGSAYGYWKFDEGTGATTYNSGSGGSTIDGTLTSATRTTGGKYGQAITFSANTNNVSIGDEAGTDSAPRATWSFWTKPGTLSTDACIWCKVNTPTATPAQSSWAIMTDSSDSSIIRAKIANAANDVSQYGSTPTGTLVNGTWAYITVVYDGTQAAANRLQIYVNGRPVTTTITGTIPTTISNTTANAVWGRASSSTAAPYNGTIDEAKLYLSALTPTQVLADMNRGQAQQLGALSDKSGNQPQSADNEYCIPGDTTTCTAPVARYDFDDANGLTTSADKSGNGNNCDNSTSYFGAPGKIGNAYNVTTTATSCGTGTTVNNLVAQGNSGMTVEAWIYPKSEGEFGIGAILSKWTGWLLRMGPSATNAINFSASHATTDLSRTTSDNTITLNKWQHVAVTWTGSTTATNAHIYINGAESTYQTTTNAVGARSSDSSNPLMVGNIFGGGGLFDGKVDQARVFNYVRTPAQIAWDYNKGAPVAWWKMDECQGTTVNDSSVNGAGTGNNGLSGTLTVGASGTQTSAGTCSTSSTAWGNGVTGKRNYSLNFDGNDDYVSVPANTTLGNLTSNLTVSAWVKPGLVNDGSSHRFLGAARNSTSNGFGLGEYQAGLIFTTYGVKDYTSTGITLTTGNWYHVVAVMDSSFAVTFYLNGVKYNTVTNGSGGNANTDDPFFLGATTAGSATPTEQFTGQIDDAKVFNYALTENQVKLLYNDGANRYGPVTGAP